MTRADFEFTVTGADAPHLHRQAQTVIADLMGTTGGTIDYALDIEPEGWLLSDSSPTVWRARVRGSIR
jgi:hypothetical protein